MGGEKEDTDNVFSAKKSFNVVLSIIHRQNTGRRVASTTLRADRISKSVDRKKYGPGV